MDEFLTNLATHAISQIQSRCARPEEVKSKIQEFCDGLIAKAGIERPPAEITIAPPGNTLQMAPAPDSGRVAGLEAQVKKLSAVIDEQQEEIERLSTPKPKTTPKPARKTSK